MRIKIKCPKCEEEGIFRGSPWRCLKCQTLYSMVVNPRAGKIVRWQIKGGAVQKSIRDTFPPNVLEGLDNVTKERLTRLKEEFGERVKRIREEREKRVFG